MRVTQCLTEASSRLKPRMLMLTSRMYSSGVSTWRRVHTLGSQSVTQELEWTKRRRRGSSSHFSLPKSAAWGPAWGYPWFPELSNGVGVTRGFTASRERAAHSRFTCLLLKNPRKRKRFDHNRRQFRQARKRSCSSPMSRDFVRQFVNSCGQPATLCLKRQMVWKPCKSAETIKDASRCC